MFFEDSFMFWSKRNRPQVQIKLLRYNGLQNSNSKLDTIDNSSRQSSESRKCCRQQYVVQSPCPRLSILSSLRQTLFTGHSTYSQANTPELSLKPQS